MPEMTFTVRWPDGVVQECYSPSLVIHDHLHTGARYTVSDFQARAIAALETASIRVREKFGFVCTSATATAEAITAYASRYSSSDVVEILSMTPALP